MKTHDTAKLEDKIIVKSLPAANYRSWGSYISYGKIYQINITKS